MRILLPLLALLWATAAQTADRPHPPCVTQPGAIVPAYAPGGAPPAVGVWKGDALGVAPPSACAPWVAWRSSLVVAVAGSFPHTEGADALLARFAAISALPGIEYWSATDQGWNRLITRAGALKGTDPGRPRGDFTVAELSSGRAFYYAQHDNRSTNAVVYRLRVEQYGPDRLVVAIENVSAVRFHLLTLFAPGALHTRHYLHRLGPELWGYYGLTGVREGAMPWASGPTASYINRSVAMYRHVTGIPTDKEPPVARDNQ